MNTLRDLIESMNKVPPKRRRWPTTEYNAVGQRCKECKVMKPYDNFYPHRNSANEIRYELTCKDCRKQRQINRRRLNEVCQEAKCNLQ